MKTITLKDEEQELKINFKDIIITCDEIDKYPEEEKQIMKLLDAEGALVTDSATISNFIDFRLNREEAISFFNSLLIAAGQQHIQFTLSSTIVEIAKQWKI